MLRIDRILKDEEFISLITDIEELEATREFCLHGMAHALDVARIGHLINLEEELGFNKDTIYAMGLLHDIGRGTEYKSKISHHIAGANLAGEILQRCDYTKEEIKEICDAIASHKAYQGDDRNLKYILFRADKLSRNCFNCKMYNQCYWSEQLKNKGIVY